ncbi:50S ribosomal protein L32 [Candidatus Margulisiibacteriota bacterium]
MAQPKKKTSKSKRDSRRAHWNKLETPNIFKCPQCGADILAHHACMACGTYKGRQVVTVKEPKTKKKS